MRVTFWSGVIPEDTYERTIKGIKSVDFYNGYVVCYKENTEEIKLDFADIIVIEED